ncbi:MAG: mechanosensitive ion channel family protein [Polyangiaceae bacterium]
MSWHTLPQNTLRLLSPDTWTGAVALLAIVVLFAWILGRALGRALDALGDAQDETARTFLRQFGKAAIWVLGLLVYAHTIPLLRNLGTALLASVSVVSLVFGMAAQSTLSNLIAGASLVAYRPFRVGDRIQVTAPTGVELGTVETISLGYTTLRTFDNRRIVLANSSVVNQTTVNLTSVDPRVLAVVPVGIGYGADLDQARAILLELAEAHELAEEVIGCPVVNLGPSSVDLSLRVWTKHPDDAWSVKTDLLEAAKRRFDEAGIEIPYAYTNVVVRERIAAED